MCVCGGEKRGRKKSMGERYVAIKTWWGGGGGGGGVKRRVMCGEEKERRVLWFEWLLSTVH